MFYPSSNLGTATVFFVKQFIEHLTVVDRRVGHRIASDQLVFLVDVDVVLVAVVALAVLLGSAGIEIILALLVRLRFPFLRLYSVCSTRILNIRTGSQGLRPAWLLRGF